MQLYNGSITDVDARAYVLGTFSGVAPTGAAGALDKLMDGALAEIIGGNMFGSRTGEVFILPLGRRAVRAETAVFVGLGAHDEFKTVPVPPTHGDKDACGASLTSQYINDWHIPVLEIAAENAMRTLARTHIEDFATVLLGGTLSKNQAAAGESLLRGLLRGLDAADSQQDMRRVTLCEMNPDRYRAIRDHLFFLTGTPLLAGIEIDINELCLESVTRFVPVTTRGGKQETPRHDPIYLTVRALPTEEKGTDLWRFTPLGPSARAALQEGEKRITRAELDAIIDAVPFNGNREPADLDKLNKALMKKLVPDSIIEELARPDHSELPVVVLHDASSAARVPWEVLKLPKLNATPIATDPKRGLSRRFIASSSDCTRWSAPSQPGQRINVLIIGDPRDNLPAASEEIESIATKLSRKTADKLSAKSLFRVEKLMHSEATKSAVLQRLKSGSFDIIHYSGHAGFDEVTKQSHLKLADGLLEGADLVNIPRLPFLMVLNACQSVRTRSDKKLKELGRKLKTADTHSIAETLLCAGIGNLIGTFWEVFDDSACEFAVELYDRLLGGSSLGEAMRTACAKIADTADWANYELFGDANATLRRI